MREVSALQVHEHEALQNVVVEDQVYEEVLCLGAHPELAADKGKTLPQLEHELPKTIDDRLLESTLVQAGVILHFQKFENVRVFDEVSRLDRRLPRLLATFPACRRGLIISQRALVRERADLPQQCTDGPALGGSLLHVPASGGLIRHSHEGAVVRPGQLATHCVAN